jgi:hypothetical protein
VCRGCVQPGRARVGVCSESAVRVGAGQACAGVAGGAAQGVAAPRDNKVTGLFRLWEGGRETRGQGLGVSEKNTEGPGGRLGYQEVPNLLEKAVR